MRFGLQFSAMYQCFTLDWNSDLEKQTETHSLNFVEFAAVAGNDAAR